MRRARVLVRGRVQGVFFRQTLAAEARARSVTGWTRNLPDGTVEAELQGEEAEVAAVLAWCRTGPPAAQVEGVETTETPVRQGEDSFDVRW